MKKYSFRTHLFIVLVVFSFFTISIIWFFQIIFLNSYYKYFKKNAMNYVSKDVIRAVSNDKIDVNELNMLSYKNNVCIEIIDNKEEKTTYTSVANNNCFLMDSKVVNKAKNKFIKSELEKITFTSYNYIYNDELLIYGKKLGNRVIFISTPLNIMNSILSVIQKEFIYGTFFVLIISLALAYFLSKKFSNPIMKMTKESKKMVNGDYDVKFKESNIEEINELAYTLNRATKELSKTENLRRELLANVSHDLKTPLTLIKANAEMVRDLTYSNEKKREANLNVIINETDRLNMLVEDILDLSQSQAKTMKLEIKRLNLNDLMKSILSRYKVLEERDNYKINFNYDKEYVIKADIKRLEQVIYNLINNAINYTGKNKVVNVNLIDNKTFVRVEVIDSGKGINEEELKYIWDKYYKADKSYHRLTVGTGLGLSIVKNLLELHNFKYGVKSSKKGTNFYFDIPKE